VFDAPSLKDKVFEDRIKEIQNHLDSLTSDDVHVELIYHEICQGSWLMLHPLLRCNGTGIDHLKERLNSVESEGGEGLILRVPNTLYESKRY
jgi:ATP-dependent DNA ligase